jgi:thioredoxin reductase (NADPH)
MNDQVIEFVIYLLVTIIIVVVLYLYITKHRADSGIVDEKIQKAKEAGIHEPVSLYPKVDQNRCIDSGACIKACPEDDILGIRDGKATIINATHCIGHGACLWACPVGAISLWIGTEKRGVDLPQISPSFETNVPGIYIAGELGGMGLIRNAVTQGQEAVENLAQTINRELHAQYDLIIVGAGPAGIAAALQAKKMKLKFLILEQNTLGGTVFTYPRAKIVMTTPMNLPLYGKVKYVLTSKGQLLNLWQTVIKQNKIVVNENTTVKTIVPQDDLFHVKTVSGDNYTGRKVLLAIGRGGSPRKLNVPGEYSEKVAYRLLDSEEIVNRKILIVGGGGAALEAALLLAEQNEVTVSYRGAAFTRINQKLSAHVHAAIDKNLINVLYHTEVLSIEPDKVVYRNNQEEHAPDLQIENDLVYIFVGGELPSEFLRKMGVEVSTTHGNLVLKHE